MKRSPRGPRVPSIAALLATALVGLGLAPPSTKFQEPPKAAPREKGVLLEVRGEVSRPLTLSREDFAGIRKHTVRAKAHDGVESEYQGVALIDLLTKAGVSTGPALKGKELTLYVVVEAADGYRATFAVAELDPTFTDRVILLADRRDGRPLSDREGPLQVIVPGEKKHARWVRQVLRLAVGRA
jgi:DMSO/TMAO reductase YedYZ molybdopterin-dependent catalytic subunit